MLNRRNIREAAIQFLYFHSLQGGAEKTAIEESFWEITQEQSLQKLNYARAKAMLHVAQGRDSKFAKLTEQFPTILAILKANPEAEASPLANLLKKIVSEQKRFTTLVEELKTAVKSKGVEKLPVETIQQVAKANQPLQESHQRWGEMLLSRPDLKNKLESTTSCISHLLKVSKRLQEIEDPDSALTDFAHLRASHSEIALSRKSITELIDNILERQEEIDEILAKTIENYQPERVDLVDKAILRLAVYEMQYCEDIPRAVSINESIEIAKRFSSTESSRFINGILDSIK